MRSSFPAVIDTNLSVRFIKENICCNLNSIYISSAATSFQLYNIKASAFAFPRYKCIYNCSFAY